MSLSVYQSVVFVFVFFVLSLEVSGIKDCHIGTLSHVFAEVCLIDFWKTIWTKSFCESFCNSCLRIVSWNGEKR